MQDKEDIDSWICRQVKGSLVGEHSNDGLI